MTATQHVRKLFALPTRKRCLVPIPETILDRALPMPGRITLITEPSGGGKSRLLQALRETHDGKSITWIDPAHVPLPNVSVIDCVCDALAADDAGVDAQVSGELRSIEHALELLSRVGLAEAWTYLQTPAELSDGQRWRLMLAIGVASALRVDPARSIAVLAMDEFAALLDRVTARIVARALRRLVDRQVGTNGPTLGAIVATSHQDLVSALQPETIITCDFEDYAVT